MDIQNIQKKVPYNLFFIFIMLSILIIIAGYFYYQNLKNYVKKEKHKELNAISDLKVEQIKIWREERFRDASFIFRNPEIAPQIKRLSEYNNKVLFKKEIPAWMDSMYKNQQYKIMSIIDKKGRVFASLPENTRIELSEISNYLNEALKIKGIFFSDLYRNNKGNIFIDIVIPIFRSLNSNKSLEGFVFLRIDPYQYLYPLIQSFPIPSTSGENLIVRKHGNEVMYLNELRHQKNTAFNLYFPLSRTEIPAVMAVIGKSGVVEGKDYRGIPVLAAIKQIPQTPWFMVTKIDMDEVFRPYYISFRLIGIIILIMILFSGTVIILLWRHQQSLFYARQYNLELKNIEILKKTEEELKKYREHLEELVKERTDELNKKNDELRDSKSKLMNLVDDLNRKTIELEQANVKLKEIDRLKSKFIASMSHELRTPLNSVIGFSSILINQWKGPLNEEQKEFASIILKAGKHLLNLVNDVIDVSKIEAGMIDVYIEDFDLHDLINEAVDSISKELKDRGLELHVQSIHQKMHTDRRRLLQCVLNLLSNAVKFTANGGSLCVAARQVKSSELGVWSQKEVSELSTDKSEFDLNMIEISVHDTGLGIKEEDIPKLFKAFVRLESPMKAIVPGTGLGLYLTKKLLTEVLKGEIIVESEYGKGSKFTIVVPIKL